MLYNIMEEQIKSIVTEVKEGSDEFPLPTPHYSNKMIADMLNNMEKEVNHSNVVKLYKEFNEYWDRQDENLMVDWLSEVPVKSELICLREILMLQMFVEDDTSKEDDDRRFKRAYDQLYFIMRIIYNIAIEHRESEIKESERIENLRKVSYDKDVGNANYE